MSSPHTTREVSHTIGVDVGTGSARACLITANGSLVGTAARDIQTFHSQPGCYEQSTSDIWLSICTAVRKVLIETRIDPATVRSIAFAATCSLAVFLQGSTDPVSVAAPDFTKSEHNVILWMHRAASSEADQITLTNHPLLRHLGGSMSPFMALPKVLWLKHNMPEALYHTCTFFDLHDALSFIATGTRKLSCPPNASAGSVPTGFGIDGSIKGWDADLLDQVGLQELAQKDFRYIGGVLQNGEPPAVGVPVGTLCVKAAQDLGLPCNVLAGTGVIDCYAGWVGTTGTPTSTLTPQTTTMPITQLELRVNERIAIVAGTSACHVLASDKSHFVSGLWGPYQDFLLPGASVVAGGQPAVGRLLQHVIETHPAYQEAFESALSQQASIFDFLNDYLDKMRMSTKAPNVAYLGRHLFFYGDHFGNRAPIGDANMTGSIIGLTGDTGLDNLAIMYYATLEFLALQTRHIISTMEQSGHTIRSICMSGSLCLNRMFIELIATVCDMPVITPRYPTAAVCYGAALIAAYTARISQDKESLAVAPADGTSDIAKSRKENLWEVMTEMSKPGTVVTPSTDEYAKKILEVKYTVFLELAERQRVFRNMVDNIPPP